MSNAPSTEKTSVRSVSFRWTCPFCLTSDIFRGQGARRAAEDGARQHLAENTCGVGIEISRMLGYISPPRR